MLPIILLVKIITYARNEGLFKKLAQNPDIEQNDTGHYDKVLGKIQETPKARRIIPKKSPKMKVVPKLKG